jgi:hypothetical protein
MGISVALLAVQFVEPITPYARIGRKPKGRAPGARVSWTPPPPHLQKIPGPAPSEASLLGGRRAALRVVDDFGAQFGKERHGVTARPPRDAQPAACVQHEHPDRPDLLGRAQASEALTEVAVGVALLPARASGFVCDVTSPEGYAYLPPSTTFKRVSTKHRRRRACSGVLREV